MSKEKSSQKILDAIAGELGFGDFDEMVEADALTDLWDCGAGLCTHCLTSRDCVEPDATRYLCDACGAHAVSGFEFLIIAHA